MKVEPRSIVVVPLVVSAPLTASIGMLWDHALWTLKSSAMASPGAAPNVSDEPATAVLAAVDTPKAAPLATDSGLASRDCPANCKTPALTVVGPV